MDAANTRAKVIYDPPFCISAESIRYLRRYSKYQPARNKVVSRTGNVTRVERFSSPPPILQDDTFRDAVSGTRPSSIDRSIDRHGPPSPNIRRNENTGKRVSFFIYPRKIITLLHRTLSVT